MAALRAGCATIEHGIYMDDECVQLMRAKAAMLIPKRTFFEAGLQVRDLWSPESFAKLEKAAATHKSAYQMAVKSGIKMTLGTDLGLGGALDGQSKVFAHGNSGKEVVYMVDFGIRTLEAIEAATANGPDTLEKQMTPKSGQLRGGWDADVIAVDGDPLQEIKVLADIESVGHVWKGGELSKQYRMHR